ncbi:MAG: NAD+ synthase [Planctomycetes bacterium]|nr:NAD+ synthase [Planctomycetota bacterium]
MKLGLLQLNPLVGDFQANLAAIEAAARKAVAQGAELCIAPELALSGYPPHDLMLQQDFVARNQQAAEHLIALSAELRCGLLFGLVTANKKAFGKPLHNAALLCDSGRVLAIKRKSLLPTYDVFDERRYFEPDPAVCVADFRGTKVGLLICEDIWTDESLLGRVDYDTDPADDCVKAGATLLLTLSASPWGSGKHRLREQLVSRAASRTGTFAVLVNQCGGNDDLIFDGASVACDHRGRSVARLSLFEPAVMVIDTTASTPAPGWSTDDLGHEINALVLGLGDYFRKTGHSRALLGLSGGIDSALVACLAARALGPANVTGISMPTRFSSAGSVDDSRALAARLCIGFEVIDIDPAFELQRKLARFPGGVAEENAQARLRGLVLMTRSNASGALVLATGNRSELAVGYSTLYGDMCGALEVIGDVPKTRVFEMARRFAEIPQAIHDKPPSAELRPNQTDQDSLPPYELLDRILSAYLDQRLDTTGMAQQGLDPALCAKITRMVELAEYKRKQAPIVLRISGHAFGAGRRMPAAKKV